jgi:hypothetical protein
VWTEAAEGGEQATADAALVVGAEGGTRAWWASWRRSWSSAFRPPAVVVGFKDGQGRGSARTTGGFNLYRRSAPAASTSWS